MRDDERHERAAATYLDVMTVSHPGANVGPARAALLDYEFGEVWSRAGLSRRDRRLVALMCLGAADTPGPLEEHVYAALNSGDLSYEAMLEFVLHFAVYCGWPKASLVNSTVLAQQARVCEEQGLEPPTFEPIEIWGADLESETRLRRGAQCFQWINCMAAPPLTSPYLQAGIVNYVFGEVWQRPHLSDRDRRVMTVAAVGVDDTDFPIRSHVYAAMKSGDVTLDEMRELVLHFSLYGGSGRASFLDEVTTLSWERIESEGGIRDATKPAYD